MSDKIQNDQITTESIKTEKIASENIKDESTKIDIKTNQTKIENLDNSMLSREIIGTEKNIIQNINSENIAFEKLTNRKIGTEDIKTYVDGMDKININKTCSNDDVFENKCGNGIIEFDQVKELFNI